jgi:hypothetical protein
MALGVKRLQRIQWGKEVTPGTAVAETTRWRGAGAMLDDQRKIEEIEEWMGVIEGADRTAVVQLLGMLNLADTPATPEQFPYLAAMAMGGPVTGSADGAGTDKIYTTNIPTTALPTGVNYTIVGGDNFETERMEYCCCTKISLKGALGQTARMGATIMGRQVSYYVTGFAAGAAIPAVSELPVQQGKLYLDAIGGAYGTTLISDLLIGFQIDMEIRWVPVFTITGNLYYSYPSYTGHKISGSLSFLHNTGAGGAASAQKALWRLQTPQLMRLDLVGDTVATGGTTYQNKRIIVDLPIKYNATPGPLADDNGNDKIDLKFRSRYNTTAGNAGKIVCVNEVTPLP